MPRGDTAVATRLDIDNTYGYLDELWRLSLGDGADITCPLYDGDFSKSLDQAQRDKHHYILTNLNVDLDELRDPAFLERANIKEEQLQDFVRMVDACSSEIPDNRLSLAEFLTTFTLMPSGAILERFLSHSTMVTGGSDAAAAVT